MRKDDTLMIRTANTIGTTLGTIVAKIGAVRKTERPTGRKKPLRFKANPHKPMPGSHKRKRAARALKKG